MRAMARHLAAAERAADAATRPGTTTIGARTPRATST